LMAGVLPLIVIGTIWHRYASIFYVRGEKPSPQVVDELRRNPDDNLLKELAQQDIASEPIPLERDPVKAPTELVQCQIETATLNFDMQIGTRLVGLSARPKASMRVLHKPFGPSDVLAMPQAWQLSLFSFGVPRIYLKAYHRTGGQQYLAAARDFI